MVASREEHHCAKAERLAEAWERTRDPVTGCEAAWARQALEQFVARSRGRGARVLRAIRGSPTGWVTVSHILEAQGRYADALCHARTAYILGADEAEIRGLLVRIRAGLGERDLDGVLRVQLDRDVL